MKLWGVLCLLGSMGGLDARIIDVSDRSDGREERSGVGVSPKDDCLKDRKAESSSVFKDNNESINSSKEEIENPDYIIISTDKSPASGGGVPSLDPNTISEMILPSFTEAETPWWTRWWEGVTAWFFGQNKETNSSEQP